MKNQFLKHIFLLGLLGLSLTVYSQQQKVKHYQEVDLEPLHFGYSIGLNTMDFVINLSDNYAKLPLNAEVPVLQPGFHVAMISDFRLNNRLTFRVLPGMAFGSRDLKFALDKENPPDSLAGLEEKIPFPYYPLEIPVLLKYRAERINNYRPYMIGGVNFRFDFADFRSNGYNYEGDTGEEVSNIKFRTFDYAYELGFGIDFYFEFFKLSTELKYSVGLRDILMNELTEEERGGNDEIYMNGIESIRSNVIMFTLHFE